MSKESVLLFQTPTTLQKHIVLIISYYTLTPKFIITGISIIIIFVIVMFHLKDEHKCLCNTWII